MPFNLPNEEELSKMFMRGPGFSELYSAALRGDVHKVKAIIKAGTRKDINGPETVLKMTPLIAAINSKNAKKILVIKELIQGGADVNSNSGPMCPIMSAIIARDVKVVRFLLDNGADIHTREIGDNSLLHAAADVGHVEIAELLIERGLKVDDCNRQNETPLHTAANIGQMEAARLLIAKGADVNARCTTLKARVNMDGGDTKLGLEKNVTPLYLAACHGHLDIVNILISAGADVNAKSRKNYTALHMAAQIGHIELVKRLLKAGATSSINVRTSDADRTPLLLAVIVEKVDVVKVLLNVDGIDLNPSVVMKQTPLGVAARSGNLKLVKSLVGKGVNVDTRSTVDSTPLMCAAANNNLEIVKFLLDRGANLEAVNNNNHSALDFATNAGHVETVAYLVAIVSENDASSPLLRMPLHMAVHKGDTEVVKILCATGIDVNGDGNAECNLLHTALTSGHLDVAEVLLKHKVRVNFRDKDGITPLFLAVKKKHLRLVNILLERGADVNSANEFGVLPIHIAVKAENVEIVKALLAKGACYNKEARTKNYLGVPLKLAKRGNNPKLVTILELIKKLFSSIIKNDTNQIELCVQAGAILNARDESGRTALHYVVSNLNVDAVKTLLAGGADITLATEKGNLPLHLAVLGESIEITEMILAHAKNLSFVKYNSTVNAKTFASGSMALHTAAENNSLPIVKLLLANGVVYNTKNYYGKTPLELTAHEEIKSLLSCAEKLFEAVKKDDGVEEVGWLLDNNVSVMNVREADNGGTALYWSVSKGYNDVANVLLAHGADYRLVTNKGTTPLHIAAAKGNAEIVNALLSRVKNEGAGKASEYVNTTTVSGTAALHVASNSVVVKCLLQAGAAYDIPNGDGKTALMLTKNDDVRRLLQTVHQVFEDVQKGSSTVMDRINSLKVGELKAVLRTRNMQGQTLVQVAQDSGYFRIADKLLRKFK